MKEPILPKVKFELAPINKTVSMIHYFLNPPGNSFDWKHYVFSQYPELEKVLCGINDKKERRKAELRFFKDFQKKNLEKINKELEYIEKDWEEISDKALKTLSQIVEIEWPVKDKEIHGYISLYPINPRFIPTREFYLYYKSVREKGRAIIIHEILHFIYFEKWKEVFPETKEREFDNPYLIWQLSEMVPTIILNDERVQNIFKHEHHSYDIYEEIEIEGKPLLSHLEKFYNERKDFEDFLRNSWGFVKKHKKEIKSKTGL